MEFNPNTPIIHRPLPPHTHPIEHASSRASLPFATPRAAANAKRARDAEARRLQRLADRINADNPSRNLETTGLRELMNRAGGSRARIEADQEHRPNLPGLAARLAREELEKAADVPINIELPEVEFKDGLTIRQFINSLERRLGVAKEAIFFTGLGSSREPYSIVEAFERAASYLNTDSPLDLCINRLDEFHKLQNIMTRAIADCVGVTYAKHYREVFDQKYKNMNEKLTMGLEDAKSELEHTKSHANFLRLDAGKVGRELTKLRDENTALRALLKQYAPHEPAAQEPIVARFDRREFDEAVDEPGAAAEIPFRPYSDRPRRRKRPANRSFPPNRARTMQLPLIGEDRAVMAGGLGGFHPLNQGAVGEYGDDHVFDQGDDVPTRDIGSSPVYVPSRPHFSISPSLEGANRPNRRPTQYDSSGDPIYVPSRSSAFDDNDFDADNEEFPLRPGDAVPRNRNENANSQASVLGRRNSTSGHANAQTLKKRKINEDSLFSQTSPANVTNYDGAKSRRGSFDLGVQDKTIMNRHDNASMNVDPHDQFEDDDLFGDKSPLLSHSNANAAKVGSLPPPQSFGMPLPIGPIMQLDPKTKKPLPAAQQPRLWGMGLQNHVYQTQMGNLDDTHTKNSHLPTTQAGRYQPPTVQGECEDANNIPTSSASTRRRRAHLGFADSDSEPQTPVMNAGSPVFTMSPLDGVTQTNPLAEAQRNMVSNQIQSRKFDQSPDFAQLLKAAQQESNEINSPQNQAELTQLSESQQSDAQGLNNMAGPTSHITISSNHSDEYSDADVDALEDVHEMLDQEGDSNGENHFMVHDPLGTNNLFEPTLDPSQNYTESMDNSMDGETDLYMRGGLGSDGGAGGDAESNESNPPRTLSVNMSQFPGLNRELERLEDGDDDDDDIDYTIPSNFNGRAISVPMAPTSQTFQSNRWANSSRASGSSHNGNVGEIDHASAFGTNTSRDSNRYVTGFTYFRSEPSEMEDSFSNDGSRITADDSDLTPLNMALGHVTKSTADGSSTRSVDLGRISDFGSVPSITPRNNSLMGIEDIKAHAFKTNELHLANRNLTDFEKANSKYISRGKGDVKMTIGGETIVCPSGPDKRLQNVDEEGNYLGGLHNMPKKRHLKGLQEQMKDRHGQLLEKSADYRLFCSLTSDERAKLWRERNQPLTFWQGEPGAADEDVLEVEEVPNQYQRAYRRYRHRQRNNTTRSSENRPDRSRDSDALPRSHRESLQGTPLPSSTRDSIEGQDDFVPLGFDDDSLFRSPPRAFKQPPNPSFNQPRNLRTDQNDRDRRGSPYSSHGSFTHGGFLDQEGYLRLVLDDDSSSVGASASSVSTERGRSRGISSGSRSSRARSYHHRRGNFQSKDNASTSSTARNSSLNRSPVFGALRSTNQVDKLLSKLASQLSLDQARFPMPGSVTTNRRANSISSVASAAHVSRSSPIINGGEESDNESLFVPLGTGSIGDVFSLLDDNLEENGIELREVQDLVEPFSPSAMVKSTSTTSSTASIDAAIAVAIADEADTVTQEENNADFSAALTVTSRHPRVVIVRLHPGPKFTPGAITKRIYGGLIQEIQFFEYERAAVVVFLYPAEAGGFVRHVKNLKRVVNGDGLKRGQVDVEWFGGSPLAATLSPQRQTLHAAIYHNATRVLKLTSLPLTLTREVLTTSLSTLLDKLLISIVLVTPPQRYKQDAEGRSAIIEFASISDAIDATKAIWEGGVMGKLFGGGSLAARKANGGRGDWKGCVDFVEDVAAMGGEFWGYVAGCGCLCCGEWERENGRG